jgi:hypothetical protein
LPVFLFLNTIRTSFCFVALCSASYCVIKFNVALHCFLLFCFIVSYLFSFQHIHSLGLDGEDRVAHMNSQTLIVGIIKTFSTRPLLFNSFCQNMENQTIKTQLSTIDLWIIFAVCGVQKNRSKIHTLLSRKYEEETLTGFTLNAAISGYGIALESVFPSLLILGINLFSILIFCFSLLSVSPKVIFYCL